MANIKIAFKGACAQIPFSIRQTLFVTDRWRSPTLANANRRYFCKPSVIRELLWAEMASMSLRSAERDENRTLF